MITAVNLNSDKHIETLDITNMHVLGKNKQEEKEKKKNIHLFLVVVVVVKYYSF